jgi:hypothetical protein
MEKTIKSVISIGDTIEVEFCGVLGIYKVEKFEVILNSPTIRPIDCVIHVSLKNESGGGFEGTSDLFKYVRHIEENSEINNGEITNELV